MFKGIVIDMALSDSRVMLNYMCLIIPIPSRPLQSIGLYLSSRAPSNKVSCKCDISEFAPETGSGPWVEW